MQVDFVKWDRCLDTDSLHTTLNLIKLSKSKNLELVSFPLMVPSFCREYPLFKIIIY